MATDQATESLALFHLPLTGRHAGRKGPIVVVGHAIVLDDDFTHESLAVRWYRTSAGYAARRAPRPDNHIMLLHRVVFEHYYGPIPPGTEVDHIDRDPLNNWPSNLRAITHSQNIANKKMRSDNTSGFVCVFPLEYRNRDGRQRYKAKITAKGRDIHLGHFLCPREAADAVNAAYAEHFPHVPAPNP